jgi:Bacteriophage replication protein O
LGSVVGVAVGWREAMTTTRPDPRDPPTPFPGFRSPTYTMVPDEVFDELLVELTGAELKVLLYIVRRTFGFKRESDTISLSQMLRGIATRDGRVLDRGVGLSKKTLLDALRSLSARRIILTQRRQSPEKGHEPTAYRLNVLHAGESRAAPLGGISTPPLGEFPHPPWGTFSPKGMGTKLPQGLGEKTPPHKTQGDNTQPHNRQDIIPKPLLRRRRAPGSWRRWAPTYCHQEPPAPVMMMLLSSC